MFVCPAWTTGYGPSHQATEDIAMMRGIPGLTIIDPATHSTSNRPCRRWQRTTAPPTCACCVAMPLVLDEYDYQFELGKAKRLVDGDEAPIISSGSP